MKFAISGKGGVGKTTLTALLAKVFVDKGYKVLAIDADPDANLAVALGVADPDAIIPIAEMHDLIAERTGVRPGTIGGLFAMNPRVDDLPEKLSTEVHGIRVMRMGTVKKGGAGCICPESTLLRALIHHLLIDRKEVVLMDMEAGIEHLGRGTAGFVDKLIIVVEPGKRSIDTAEKIRELASDLHLDRIVVVGNKIRTQADREFILHHVKHIPILGFLPFAESIVQADKESTPTFAQVGSDISAIAHSIADALLVPA